jgi:hypothetical protein
MCLCECSANAPYAAVGVAEAEIDFARFAFTRLRSQLRGQIGITTVNPVFENDLSGLKRTRTKTQEGLNAGVHRQ